MQASALHGEAPAADALPAAPTGKEMQMAIHAFLRKPYSALELLYAVDDALSKTPSEA